ncbi:MAG: menaquinone biosynthesis protein [Selenomonadaceae bacterium]|nr:menaquinone biosynthesis protein [Selenomonadaceae bacterium]MBR4696121.1 menaquinone biosynthesis protein [Selenomonadaceae bacterium]
MKQPQIGHINFLNVLPLTYSYAHGYSEGLALTQAVPAELNRRIRERSLDVSAVSSIVYARNSEDLLLLPDICIRSDADVESIVLVSRKPAGELGNGRVILTAKSETSHCLLKIILHTAYRVMPEYEIRPIGLEDFLPEDATASLLIGDDALYLYHHRQPDLFYYDLGKEWNKLTGHSMVYAVWAVQKSFAEAFPDLLRLAHERIVGGMREGLRRKQEAIRSVLAEKNLSYEILDHYLGNIIRWDFTEKHLESLRLFYRLAHEQGLVREVPDLRMARA